MIGEVGFLLAAAKSLITYRQSLIFPLPLLHLMEEPPNLVFPRHLGCNLDLFFLHRVQKLQRARVQVNVCVIVALLRAVLDVAADGGFQLVGQLHTDLVRAAGIEFDVQQDVGTDAAHNFITQLGQLGSFVPVRIGLRDDLAAVFLRILIYVSFQVAFNRVGLIGHHGPVGLGYFPLFKHLVHPG